MTSLKPADSNSAKNNYIKNGFIVLFVAVVIIGSIRLNYVWKSNAERTANDAIYVAKMAEASMNDDYIKSVVESGINADNPNISILKEKMLSLRSVMKNARFAYVFTEINDKLYIIADSEPVTSKDYSPPWQAYSEASAEYNKPFIDGKAIVTQASQDRWGTWRSVLIPIKDNETGNVIAVFAMDYPAENWNYYAYFYSLISFFVTAEILLLVMALYFVYKKSLNLSKMQRELSLASLDISKAQQIYTDMFEKNQSVKLLINADTGKIINANAAACAFYGFNINEMKDLYITDINTTDKEVTMNNVKLAKDQKRGRFIFNHRLSSGEVRDVEVFSSTLETNGEVVLYSVIYDISDRKKAEKALRESEERYVAIFEQSPIAIEFYDTDGCLVNANNACLDLFGISSINDVKGFKLFDDPNINDAIKAKLLNHERVRYEAKFNFDEVKRLGLYNTLCSGIKIIDCTINPLKHENLIIGYIVQIQDISDQKQGEQEILHLSNHDQLTGLKNRRYYDNEMHKFNDEKYFPLSLIMADVNGLKLTNDAFGHKAGDLLLGIVADILKSECRTDDIVARIGGDEFVVLLPETDIKHANLIISRINAAIAKVTPNGLIISLSMGTAEKSHLTDDNDEFFKKAEDSMYRHKLAESMSMRRQTIDLIINTLFEKNNREMLHSKRVSELCEAIATKLNLDKNMVNQLKIAGLMHDIGKIGIDESIINNRTKLTNNEWAEIKRHPEIGYRILSSVNEFSEIAEYVLEHHERLDGSGYPRGFKGNEISLQARIIAISDSFDAMTSERTYKDELSEDEAIEELRRNSGTQFDSDVAKVFVEKVLGKAW